MVWFGGGFFFGISTLVGYLIPNPVCTYLFNIYICKHFVDSIFKRT